MFTGIISAMGHISNLQHCDGDVRLTIDSDSLSFLDVALGDSIACNGACLTAVELGNSSFAADVSRLSLIHI